MDKIPTAEEFWELKYKEGKSEFTAKHVMIEFAKLHVKAALEAANNNVELSSEYLPDADRIEYYVNSKSILNAYPEENIK